MFLRKQKSLVTMIFYLRFLLLVLLLKLGNGKNQHVPGNEIVPFHLYDNGTMVEFPSIPALSGTRFTVNNMYNESHILHMSLHDPTRCLPRFFLERSLYNSSIYPLEFVGWNQNVTFFNCSSAGSRHLRNINNLQDMFTWPIYVVSSDDSILEWDVASCTMMFQLASPIQAFLLQDMDLELRWHWPQPKSDVEKHKPSIIPAIVLPAFTSITTSRRREKIKKDYKSFWKISRQ